MAQASKGLVQLLGSYSIRFPACVVLELIKHKSLAGQSRNCALGYIFKFLGDTGV